MQKPYLNNSMPQQQQPMSGGMPQQQQPMSGGMPQQQQPQDANQLISQGMHYIKTLPPEVVQNLIGAIAPMIQKTLKR